jgi:hypothetical protein
MMELRRKSVKAAQEATWARISSSTRKPRLPYVQR